MGKLVKVDDIDNFSNVRDIRAAEVSSEVVSAVQALDEREELEPFLLSILHDPNETPHGPAEIVDILTHKVTIARESGMAAFILKGKSFPKVRPSDVAHQIYRLENIAALRFAVFAATGTILDGAKEQFVSTADRLDCKYAIFDAVDLARLLIAYGFLCPRDARRIIAGRCRCGYSPRHRILNPLQTETMKLLAQAHGLGQSAALVVLPPGGGKTRIAAEDAKHNNARRVLYVAHTHEILDVAQSEFVAVFGSHEVVRHAVPCSLDSLRTVNLATIQLLQNNLHRIRAAKFDYLVIDEFHHAAAKSYRELLDQISPAFLLGLTATPFRGDRQDIAELCHGNVVVNFELRSGIGLGVLSPYHYFGCFDDVDYSNIRHNGGRYDIRDLERALIIPQRDSAIILKWRQLADGKPTLAFCCSHRHAQRFSESLQNAGISAAAYISSNTMEERRHLVERLQEGDLSVLCVVDILNEGADLPFVECLLFLRPTESQRIFYQQLGRGLRRYTGKSHCTVVDFIGNFRNAYRIMEYQGLLPYPEGESPSGLLKPRSIREVLNLPLGCEVHFEDSVIDIFSQQTHDPRYATRHNIGRILLYQYQRLTRRLGHWPSQREVDRNLRLGSELYRLVFGTWKAFVALAQASEQPPGA